MIEKLGNAINQVFLKIMPSAFVFALILTLLTFIGAYGLTNTSFLNLIEAWFNGFFDLLGFAMQIVLIVVTGYSIALAPIVRQGIDKIAKQINTPAKVYVFVIVIGLLLSLVSFGWLVITSVLARELAQRVKGIHYPFLAACVYLSFNSWVMGLSSSIPLLLNTENNFLIESGLLNKVIPSTVTLFSMFNLTMILSLIVVAPITMLLIRPRSTNQKDLINLQSSNTLSSESSIIEEAQQQNHPQKTLSDQLNNSHILLLIIGLLGMSYIIYHFATKGLDLNFNIMIFIFLFIGILLHKTPSRFALAMKKSSSNISGIVFQYPFYAGIMGIMISTGLGEQIGAFLASIATKETIPFYAYLTGGLVNFAIPSAGGEFAVIGPSIINAVRELSIDSSAIEMNSLLSRTAMSVAYGESLSNMLQPFFLLIILPVMGKGVNLQARDIIGYMLIPFLILFLIQSLLVAYWPL